MPKVDKTVRYVTIGYTLRCGYERGIALAADLEECLKDDKGFDDARDASCGWDGDRMSHIKVTYCTLEDAVRLDPEVRALLSRNVDFTLEATQHISYGRTGPSSYYKFRTTVTPR